MANSSCVITGEINKGIVYKGMGGCGETLRGSAVPGTHNQRDSHHRGSARLKGGNVYGPWKEAVRWRAA